MSPGEGEGADEEKDEPRWGACEHFIGSGRPCCSETSSIYSGVAREDGIAGLRELSIYKKIETSGVTN